MALLIEGASTAKGALSRKARNSVGPKVPILGKGRSAYEATVAAVVASAAATSSRHVLSVASEGPRLVRLGPSHFPLFTQMIGETVQTVARWCLEGRNR